MIIHAIIKYRGLRSGIALGLVAGTLFVSSIYANPLLMGRSGSSQGNDRATYERMTLDELRSAYRTLRENGENLIKQKWYESQEAINRAQPGEHPLVEYENAKLQIINIDDEIESEKAGIKETQREGDVDPDMLSFSERNKIEGHARKIAELENQKSILQQRIQALEATKTEYRETTIRILKEFDTRYQGQVNSTREARQIIEDVVKKKFGERAGVGFLWTTETVNEPKLLEARQNQKAITGRIAGARPAKKGNTIIVSEPDAASKTGKRWLTLKKGLVEALYKKFPALAGVIQRAFLITPDEGKGEVKEIIREQGKAEVAQALQGENDPRTKNEVSQAMESVAESHADKVSEVCAEEGRKVFNSQNAGVKKNIIWGRTVGEWWENGARSLKEGNLGRFLWGTNVLFISVAIWDIASALLNGDYEQAGEITAWFVVITGSIYAVKYIPLIGAGLATGLDAVLLVWGLYSVYSRLSSFVSGLIDSYYERQYERFILADEPCEMSGPTGQTVSAPNIGFFNFIGSPAYGLDRQTWFLQFPDREELYTAIRDYRNAVAYYFMGQENVPPKFNQAANLLLLVKIIGNEWATKWKEQREKVSTEMQKLAAEGARRALNLDYPLQNVALPDPLGLILGVKMEPERPAVGSEVKFKTYYAVAALPGDRLNAIPRSEFTKDGSSSGFAPQPDAPQPCDFRIAQGFKILTSEHRFTLPAAGEYEYTVNLNLDQGGRSAEPGRIKFRVGAAENSPSCGFNFWTHAQDGAMDELNEELKGKMKALLPALPFYGQSNIVKQGKTLADPTIGSYTVEDSGLVPIGGGTKEWFSLGWSAVFRAWEPSADDLRNEQESAKNDLRKYPDFQENPLGSNSCLGAGAGRGSLDIQRAADPYTSGAVVRLRDSCFVLDVSDSLSSFPSAAHGSRDKPGVMDAMRAVAKEKAMAAAIIIHETVSAALQETVARMNQWAGITTPTPGRYSARMEKEGDYPERSLTFILKATAAGKFDLEGEAQDPDGTYKIKAVYDRTRNEISGQLTYPGKSDSEIVYGKYLQFRRGFKIGHFIEKKNERGEVVNRTFEYLCRYAGN